MSEVIVPQVIPAGNESKVLCYRCDNDGLSDSVGTRIFVKAKVFPDTSSLYVRVYDGVTVCYNSEITLDANHSFEGILYSGDTAFTILTTKKYTVLVQASDGSNGSTITFLIPSAKTLIHIPNGGKKICVGGYTPASQPDNSVLFAEGFKAIFDGGMYVNSTNLSGITDFTIGKSYNLASIMARIRAHRLSEDGFLEQWLVLEATVGAWNAWGTLYESDGYVQGHYTYQYLEPPIVTASLEVDTGCGGFLESYVPSDTQGNFLSLSDYTPPYFLVRPNNSPSVSSKYRVHIYSVGKYSGNTLIGG